MSSTQSSSFTAINARSNDPRTLPPLGRRAQWSAAEMFLQPASTRPGAGCLSTGSPQSGRHRRNELPPVITVHSLSQPPASYLHAQQGTASQSDNQSPESSRPKLNNSVRLGASGPAWSRGEVPLWHVSSDRSGRYTATQSTRPLAVLQSASGSSNGPTRPTTGRSDTDGSMACVRPTSSDSTRSDTSNRVAPETSSSRVISASTNTKKPKLARARRPRPPPKPVAPLIHGPATPPPPPPQPPHPPPLENQSEIQSETQSPTSHIESVHSALPAQDFRELPVIRYDNWPPAMPRQYMPTGHSMAPDNVTGWPDMAYHNLPSLPFGEGPSMPPYQYGAPWVHQQQTSSAYQTGPSANMSWATASTSLSMSSQDMTYQQTQAISYPLPTQPVPIPNAQPRLPPTRSISGPRISDVNEMINHGPSLDVDHTQPLNVTRNYRPAFAFHRNPQAATQIRSLAANQILVLFTPLLPPPSTNRSPTHNPFERLGRQIHSYAPQSNHQYYEPRLEWPCNESHRKLCDSAAGVILVICAGKHVGVDTLQKQEKFAAQVRKIMRDEVPLARRRVPLILVRIGRVIVDRVIKGFDVEIVSERYDEDEMDRIARLIFRE